MGRKSRQKAEKRGRVYTATIQTPSHVYHYTSDAPIVLAPPPPAPPLRVGQPVWCVQAVSDRGMFSGVFETTPMTVVRVEAKTGRAILEDARGGVASVFPDEIRGPDPTSAAYFCAVDPKLPSKLVKKASVPS